MTTNNLTEQWKNGELENGEYFALTNLGIEKIEFIKEHNGFGFDEIEWVLEVLAPVPSYEQWQSLNEIIDSMNDTNKALAHRLNMLKELLKECGEWIEFMEEKSRADENYKGTMYFKNLLTKIDEVLK